MKKYEKLIENVGVLIEITKRQLKSENRIQKTV
jgi:hypothetical protein